MHAVSHTELALMTESTFGDWQKDKEREIKEGGMVSVYHVKYLVY